MLSLIASSLLILSISSVTASVGDAADAESIFLDSLRVPDGLRRGAPALPGRLRFATQ